MSQKLRSHDQRQRGLSTGPGGNLGSKMDRMKIRAYGRRELFVAPLTTISSVMAYRGRLYAKAGATIVEMTLHEAMGNVSVSEGSIYTVLGHMERDGIIAEVPGPKRLQGRPRKHYLLTESGRVAGEEVRSILRRLAGETWPTS